MRPCCCNSVASRISLCIKGTDHLESSNSRHSPFVPSPKSYSQVAATPLLSPTKVVEQNHANKDAVEQGHWHEFTDSLWPNVGYATKKHDISRPCPTGSQRITRPNSSPLLLHPTTKKGFRRVKLF